MANQRNRTIDAAKHKPPTDDTASGLRSPLAMYFLCSSQAMASATSKTIGSYSSFWRRHFFRRGTCRRINLLVAMTTVGRRSQNKKYWRQGILFLGIAILCHSESVQLNILGHANTPRQLPGTISCAGCAFSIAIQEPRYRNTSELARARVDQEVQEHSREHLRSKIWRGLTFSL